MVGILVVLVGLGQFCLATFHFINPRTDNGTITFIHSWRVFDEACLI